MKRYLLKRVLISILILFGICGFVFCLIQIAPGNPYMDSMKPGMTPKQIQDMLQEKGYYDPIYIKFIKWLKDILKLDLGYSIKYNKKVIEIILEKIPNTLFLTIPSMIIALCFSVKIGRYVAYKGGKIEVVLDFISGIGVSIPTFLLAIFIIKFLAMEIPIFPVSGTGVYFEEEGINVIIKKIYYGFLPVTVLSFIQFSYFVKYIKSHMKTIKNELYIRTYQGFGMTRYEAYKEIGFKNCLPKIFTMIFTEIPSLFSGVLITETVFVWPGIGKLNFDAVSYRDYPLIMGIILMIAFTVLISNFCSDILNYYLDKRIGI